MLNEKTLKSALESGSVLPVYLIAGDDTYLKKQALDRIIKATVEDSDEMNLIKFDSEVNFQTVYDELNGFPIMADKKCVVLSEYEIDDAPKAELEKLIELASEPYDTSVFVIYFGAYEVDFKKPSNAFKQLMSAVESSGGAVVRINCKSADELARWLVSSAKKNGLALSLKNANYLIERCTLDINVLSSELIKLSSFLKEGEITREIIDKVCVKSAEASIYDMADMIIAGNTSGAMQLLDELFYLNVQSMPIFVNIALAYVNMYRAMSAKPHRKDLEELGEEFSLGARKFLLKKASYNLKNFNAEKLKLSFDALINAEKELKSYSGNDRIILEKLIVRLIYIAKTGEALG